MADPHAPQKPLEISDATRREMESICHRATAGQELDPRVRDELYAHLEDKLIGYLRGEERLTEADAMILVREHFGRPEALRPFFADVHRKPEAATGPALWRRIAGAAVVLAAACAAFSVLRNAILVASVQSSARDGMVPSWMATSFWVAALGASVVTTAVLYAALRRWGAPDIAEHAWFARWTPLTLVGAFVLLFLLDFSAAFWPVIMYSSLQVRAQIVTDPPYWVFMLLGWLSSCASGLQCLAWIAWIAAPDRRSWKVPAIAASAWVLFWPVWSRGGLTPTVNFSGVWSIGFYPSSMVVTVALSSLVAALALGLYLAPRVYRSLKARYALRAAVG